MKSQDIMATVPDLIRQARVYVDHSGKWMLVSDVPKLIETILDTIDQNRMTHTVS